MTLTAYVEVCVSILKKAGLASRNFIYVVLTFYYILVVYLNRVNIINNIYWLLLERQEGHGLERFFKEILFHASWIERLYIL